MVTSEAKTSNKGILVLLIVLAGLSIMVTGLLTTGYLSQRSQLENTAFDSARQQATEAANEINGVVGGVMAIAQQIADDLTNGTLDYQAIDDRLGAEVNARPDIDGLAITFEPFVYDQELRLYQTYHFKDADGNFDILRGATYDYTEKPSDEPDSPQTAWYHNPLENGAQWTEPFLATGAGKILIEYGIPFFRTDPDSGEVIPAGVVTIDYSLAGMRDLTALMELGATGYGYVISETGTFLAHPVQRLLIQSTIFDFAESLQNETIADAGRQVLQGVGSTMESVDPITGEGSWLFFEPIPVSGWALGIVLNKAEFAPDTHTTLQEQVTIFIAGAVTAFFMVAIIVRADRGTSRSLWILSITFALLCLAIIVGTWYLATTLPRGEGIAITDDTMLNRYLESYLNSPQSVNSEEPIIVPTGVFVQAMQFPDPLSATVNGYIWQRYHKSEIDEISEGFMLPQRIGEESTIEMIQREEQGDDIVVVWYFGVTFRQRFNPDQFPFDNRDVEIRLTPRDLNANIILVPDLNSYTLINPRLLPGLDSALSLPNWQIESSVYSFRTPEYNTNLGLPNRQFTTAPELHFIIHSQRRFIGPFIAYLLPGIVAGLMMFAFLLSERKPQDREEIVTTLNYAAALFFVIAVAHTALRDSIAAVGLTYLEYLYILLYIAIVGVSVNTFLIVKRPHMQMVQHRDNLIPKLLYWPLLAGTLLVVTLLIFVFAS